MKQIILLIFLLSTAHGSYAQDLRITEIMYNPSNSDSAWEWIEVYNAGTELVDLTGYVIDDNSGAPYGEANIPSGSILSGQSAILYNASSLSESDFMQVWGTVNLIPVTRWSSLNNGGDAIGIWKSFETYSGDNSSQKNVIEQVLYEADGEIWPEDDGSASIYLTNLAADNNHGANWALSTEGNLTPLFKAYTSVIFEEHDGQDVGSPGPSDSVDTENPSITCPENIDMAADIDNCGSTFPFLIPTGSDNSTEELVFEGIRDDGLELTDIYPVGLTTITWTAADEAGNVSEPCDQIILITDDAPPSISCPESVDVLSADGNPVLMDIDLATASNVCGGEVLVTGTRSDEKELEEPFAIGGTTITWRATDDSGNATECEQLVTVNLNTSMDKFIISFSIPNQLGDIIVDNENKTVLLKVPFGTEVVALVPTIEISEGATVTPGSGIGQDFSNPIEYTVTAQDGSEQVWTVTVEKEEDIISPVIDCPNDIIVQNDEEECGAVVQFDVSFSDEDADATLEVSMESGSIFPIGTTEIAAIATDSSGNSTTCNFNIIVEDNSPPILICKDATVQLDSGGNADILISDLYETLSDNCEIDTTTASKLSFSEADMGDNEVTLTAVDVNGNETSCVVLVSVLPLKELDFAVGSFTLINSDTNEDLFLIEEGMQIDMKDLPTLNLDIRANASEDVESVRLSLNGVQSISRTENIAPYALFGDAPAGNYNGNDFIEGTYMLTAAPYSEDNLGGNTGEILSINFELYDESVISITEFMLVNAETDEDLFLLTEGMQIDLSSLSTHNLDIRANTDGDVESVQLQLEGNLEIIRTENLEPYALYGDSPAGVYNGAAFTAGVYKISASPYALDRLGGKIGASLSVNFELVDLTPILSVTSFILINADTNEDILTFTDGMQIEISSLPTLNLDIRANTTDDVESVSSSLSGEQTASRTENVAPYALFGDFPAGNYNGNDFEAGNYSITAVGYSQDNLGGEIGEPLSISFELFDTQLSVKQANQMSVYPNPASIEAILQFETPEILQVIYLYDLLGRVVDVYEGSEVESDGNYILNVESIPEGAYFINLRGERGILYQKQIVIKK